MRDRPTTDTDSLPVTVHAEEATHELEVPRGTILRDALLEAGLSPYTALTESANCGGRGLCATCGVRLLATGDRSVPAPAHWHDRLAAKFGYPRLSCQISVSEPLTVGLVTDKRVWGGREK